MYLFLIAVGVIAAFVGYWKQYFFSFLGWLYLARVSVVGLAIMFALPLAARGAGRSLCIGVYDIGQGSFFVGLLLPMAAWATFLSAAIVFAYGARRARFDVAPPPEWLPAVWRGAIAVAVVLNVWTIFAATDGGENKWSVMSWLAGGLFVGTVGVWLWEEAHRRRSGTWVGGNMCLLPHRGETMPLHVVAERQHDPDVKDGLGWLLRGYRKDDDRGGWDFMPGHKMSLLVIVLFLFVNLVIFIYQYNREGNLPALVYLLVLHVTAVLALGDVAFFLDAYRLPFISVLIVWLLLAGQGEQADHFYRIWPRAGGEAKPEAVLTPGQLLEKAGEAGRPIVLVAIAGGGIQSSAWGAQVLTGLEEASSEAKKLKGFGPGLPDFAGCVQCVSGVSGGSTGAMFFVAAYGKDGLPAPRKRDGAQAQNAAGILPKIVAAAEASSLGPAVWGLAYPDLRRAWFPFGIRQPYRDRGEKMESKWAQNGEENMGPLGAALKVQSLAGWQDDVREGIRPAIIFNATNVETGERICFSTAPTRMRSGGQREFVIAAAASEEIGRQLYPGADLRITTAARLSATFPFISPSARPRVAENLDDGKGIYEPAGKLAALIPGLSGLRHAVDGGYFENTGLGALSQWLDEGLTELTGKKSKTWPRSILVILLDGFPASPAAKPEGTPPVQGAGERGTLFQIASPLTALYNVRGTGHTAAAEHAFELLQQRWLRSEKPKTDAAGQIAPQPDATCEIQMVRFTIPVLPHDPSTREWWEPAWADPKADAPPLSWHLRRKEKSEVANAWLAFRCESRELPFPEHGKKPLIEPSKDRVAKHPEAEKDPGVWPVDKVLQFLRDAKPPMNLTAEIKTTPVPEPSAAKQQP